MRALTAENRRLTEANRRQGADVRLLAERLQTLSELVDQALCGAFNRPARSDAAFGIEFPETATASTDKILGQIQAGVAGAKKNRRRISERLAGCKRRRLERACVGRRGLG